MTTCTLPERCPLGSPRAAFLCYRVLLLLASRNVSSVLAIANPRVHVYYEFRYFGTTVLTPSPKRRSTTADQKSHFSIKPNLNACVTMQLTTAHVRVSALCAGILIRQRYLFISRCLHLPDTCLWYGVHSAYGNAVKGKSTWVDGRFVRLVSVTILTEPPHRLCAVAAGRPCGPQNGREAAHLSFQRKPPTKDWTCSRPLCPGILVLKNLPDA